MRQVPGGQVSCNQELASWWEVGAPGSNSPRCDSPSGPWLGVQAACPGRDRHSGQVWLGEAWHGGLIILACDPSCRAFEAFAFLAGAVGRGCGWLGRACGGDVSQIVRAIFPGSFSRPHLVPGQVWVHAPVSALSGPRLVLIGSKDRTGSRTDGNVHSSPIPSFRQLSITLRPRLRLKNHCQAWARCNIS